MLLVVNPGVSCSTMMQLYSLEPSSRVPVTHCTVEPAVIGVPALVMKILLPLMIQRSPSSRALVLVPPASEPADGSVRPKPHSRLPLQRSGR
jgi:hypothetical protein